MRFIVLILILSTLKAFCYNLEFFERFDDAYLTGYINEALSNNHSLKEAQARSTQYREEVKSALAGEFPSLTAGANYLGTHFPNNDINFFVQKNSFIVPLQAAWEADLLLKTKDKIKSRKHLYLAQKASQEGVYLSLLCDLASCYINILLYDYLIEKQQEIVALKEKNLSFDFNKFRFGTIDEINLNTSKENFNTQEILYETMAKKRREVLYNFALLLGRSAEGAGFENDFKRGKIEIFEYKSEIPKSISSDLVSLRPDLIEAEQKLKSAKIDITIAKKDFFPTFNITGLLAFDTTGAGNFFSWGSSFAYLLAGASQDIFKGGAKVANLKIKKAKFEELFENYKQKDLNAIKEISNALNIIDKDTKNEQISNKQLKLKKQTLDLSAKKFKHGANSKIDFINDRNSFLQQEQLTAASKALRLVDYITLYKAAGGEL